MNALPVTDPTLAVHYRRVSSAEQRERGYGLAAQAEAVERFATAEGFTVVGSFADPDVSGTLPLEDRPGLTAALDAVLRTGAGALIVARHDRLARDTLQALLIERAFAQAGARILYAEGGNGETDADNFTRTIMHAAAEQAKRDVVRRLAAGRALKAKAGGYTGGRPMYGYRAHGRALVIDPDAAEIVRRIFDLARHGHSITAIARTLNAEKAGERRWHATQVARILSHEAYKLGPASSRIVDPKIYNAAHAALAGRLKRQAA